MIYIASAIGRRARITALFPKTLFAEVKMKKLFVIAGLLLFPVAVLAQDPNMDHQHMDHAMNSTVEQDWAKQRIEKSTRHQEWVKVKNGTRTISSFIVYPEVKGKATAVVVIHEIFGLSDWARELTDELAAAGYIAIVPDLLSGAGPNGGGTESLDNA